MAAGDHSSYAAASAYLFGLKPRGQKLGVDRMRPFAAALGSPERAVPCIHVAGTNGKGSVAAMVEAVLRAAGWKVGLYTSPHLMHLGERVQVNREPLSHEQIVEYVRELDPVADAVARDTGADNRPSFFEFTTAMALLHFGRTRCDIAVIEVGLGGEFDATNIVSPLVSVITSIGLDHCEWLGNTIQQIATAKAGIIKRSVPVVVGRMPKEAERVIRDRANVCGSKVLLVREAFGDESVQYPTTNLLGEYQRWNAATAMLAVRQLAPSWRISDGLITKGLQNVKWPARWEKIRLGDQPVILDASHNPEGAGVLERNLATLVSESGKKPTIVTGVLGAERAGPLIAAICRHAAAVYFVVPNQPRACSHAELEALVPSGFSGQVYRSTVADLFPGGRICAVGTREDTIVVTGSIYLVGEVMQRLASEPR